MTSTTVHHTSKQRRFPFIPMLATSALLMIATLMGCLNLSTVHVQAQARAIPLMDGKVDIYSTTTQTNTRFTLTNKSDQTITSLTLDEFYTRPTDYMPNSSAPSCSTPILSFTPSINVKDATSACPWFTCNYLSWSKNGSGQCTSQGLTLEDMNAHAKPKTIAEFRLLQSTATTLDSYMTINFDSISLAPGDSLVLDSCIYYDNWPRFSEQKNVLVVHSGNTLLWGTPPNGVTMATIQSQETETVGQVTTGWGS